MAADAAARVANYAATLGLTCIYEDQGFYLNGIDGFAPLLSLKHLKMILNMYILRVICGPKVRNRPVVTGYPPRVDILYGLPGSETA